MPTIEIRTAEGRLVVDPSPKEVNRGDVVTWTTPLVEGATIVPRQDGLTVLKRTAEVGAPAVALATNTGFYQYDAYWPGLENFAGGTRVVRDPQRITAVLIVADYK